MMPVAADIFHLKQERLHDVVSLLTTLAVFHINMDINYSEIILSVKFQYICNMLH